MLFVEGITRVSTAIKYFIESTWSHAARYVGNFQRAGKGRKASVLIGAVEGRESWLCRSPGTPISTRASAGPRLEHLRSRLDEKPKYTVKEILHIPHYSLFLPRDFDISPYSRVIKPATEAGFDYKNLPRKIFLPERASAPHNMTLVAPPSSFPLSRGWGEVKRRAKFMLLGALGDPSAGDARARVPAGRRDPCSLARRGLPPAAGRLWYCCI